MFMLIFKRLILFLTALFIVISGNAFAFDGAPADETLERMSPAAPSKMRGRGYRNASDALRQGIENYQSGEKSKAADALEFAADEGNIAARWKLGRMYADGDGVIHDDYKAYKNFLKVADENADVSPNSQFAPTVAKAFVALGTYYRDGIKNTNVKPNLTRAHELFHYAAAYFADSDGQYHLGRLYLDGLAGEKGNYPEKDSRRAAQWLNLSAEKGHVYAMAVLGNLLVNGDTQVAKQVPKGLMWLDLAKEKADKKRDLWVITLNETAIQNANEEHKALAEKFKKQHASQMNTSQIFDQRK
jgi:uncharacterized protein